MLLSNIYNIHWQHWQLEDRRLFSFWKFRHCESTAGRQVRKALGFTNQHRLADKNQEHNNIQIRDGAHQSIRIEDSAHQNIGIQDGGCSSLQIQDGVQLTSALRRITGVNNSLGTNKLLMYTVQLCRYTVVQLESEKWRVSTLMSLTTPVLEFSRSSHRWYDPDVWSA